MKIKYFSIDKSDETLNDVLIKLKRELGIIKLYSYSPVVVLFGNQRILELKQSLTSDILIKVDGPDFLINELKDYFTNGNFI